MVSTGSFPASRRLLKYLLSPKKSDGSTGGMPSCTTQGHSQKEVIALAKNVFIELEIPPRPRIPSSEVISFQRRMYSPKKITYPYQKSCQASNMGIHKKTY